MFKITKYVGVCSLYNSQSEWPLKLFLPRLCPTSVHLPFHNPFFFSFLEHSSFFFFFFLQANKFDVALCLIPFQACSCFGNRRKKIPITNQIKALSVKRNWKQQASKRPAHELPCSGFQHNSNQKHITIIWNSPLLTQDRWWVITHASLINKFQH